MTLTNLKIDKDLIRELAQLLKDSGLSEIEIESAGHRIRVAAAQAQAFIRADAIAAPAHAPAAAAAPATPHDHRKHPGAVTSPMVGTAYLASQPGADPFVKVGDTVKSGQTLLIVEAMKTMNPITAPRAGTIREILVGDGQPVEFGEALMIIE